MRIAQSLCAYVIAFAMCSLSTFTVVAQLPSYLPTDGLVAWYPFNGNANDESGNGNHGVVYGATLTDDRFGATNAAYSFNSSYIEVPNSSDFTFSNFSFSLWIKSTTSTPQTILKMAKFQGAELETFGFGVGSFAQIQFGANYNDPNCIPGFGWQLLETAPNTDLLDNTYHHFVCTANGSIMSMYIDGQFFGSLETGNNPLSFCPGGDIQIGRNWSTFLNYYIGMADDIGIWNRPLSAQEAQSLFNSPESACQITASAAVICPSETVELSVNSGSVVNASACSSNQLPANLQNGLVAYYPFCGNANDASGNGNDGVVNGASLTNNRFGIPQSSFAFDGVNDYIRVNTTANSNLSAVSALTISAWVKLPSNSPNVDQGFVTKWNPISASCGNPVAPAYWLGYYGQGNTWIGATNNNGNPNTCVGSSAIKDNQWHLLVYTHDASGEKFFVDGLLTGTAVFNGAICATANALLIGADNTSGQIFRYLKGSLDDIGIWNRALSLQEVAQLYNNQSALWSTGATTPSITVAPTETTTYSVTVTQEGQTCTSDVTITVNQPSAAAVEASIIEGESYEFNGQSLTEAGTYEAVLVNASGCDSVVTLTLTVNPALNCEIIASATSICGSALTCSSIELPANLQNGLIAYYPFCGNAQDASGNGNDGLVNGAVLSSDRFGNAASAYYFNGVNSRIDLSSINESGDFSISYWEKINDMKFSYPIGLGVNTTSYYNGYGIGQAGITGECGLPDNIHFVFDGETVCTNVMQSSVQSVAQQWRLVSFTYEQGNSKLYYNGNLVSESTELDYPGFFMLTLGIRSDGAWPFGGWIDDVLVHNRALEMSEIQSLLTDSGVELEIALSENDPLASACTSSQLPTNLQNGLIAYYPFCGNAHDVSGNGNDGQVSGAILSSDRFGSAASAYYFNGVNSRIDLSSINESGDFSISYWEKINDMKFSYPIGLGVNTTSYYNGYGIGQAGITGECGLPDNIHFVFDGETVCTNVMQSSVQSAAQQWRLVSFTYEQGNSKLYYNGNLVSESSELDYPGFFMLTLGIRSDSAFPFDGWIDDVLVHNRALSAEEIQSLNGGQVAQILWSNGATTPSITVAPTETTTYSVTVTQDGQTCTSDVIITVNQPSASSIEATITEGETYEFNGQSLTTAGTYEAVLVNAAGCDSVVTLTLTVNPAFSCEIQISDSTLCAGDESVISCQVSGVTPVLNGDYFYTDFESCNLNQFTYSGGSIGITNSSYLGSCAVAMSHFAGQQPNNFYPSNRNFLYGTYKVQANATGFISDNNMYLFQGDDLGGGLSVASLPNNTDNPGLYISGLGINFSTPSINVTRGQWYELKVEVFPNIINVYINGSLRFSTTSFIAPTAGRFKLGVAFTGTYDNMEFIPYNASSFLWSNGATTPSITVAPIETTTYSVTVTQDGQTCTSDVTIEVLPTETFFADNDGDGFGDPNNGITSCTGQPQGYVTDNTDCDDTNATVFIGASCDDGDACTEGDILRGDCTCEGTYADNDQDGTCNALDLCASGPEPGTACDDNNPCTIGDSIQDDCTCAGQAAEPETSFETAQACEPFSWNGEVYTQSGTYTYTTTNALGCDSIATLELTVGAPSSSSTTINACSAYNWNGQVYTQSGTYTYVTPNASGCDSTATLVLTIQSPSVAPTAINASALSVTVGGSVTLSVSGGSLGTGAQWKWYSTSCGGQLLGTGNSITLAVNATTTFFVRAEGDCNVTNCASVTISAIAIPCGPQSVSASALSVCYGSSTMLTVSGQLNTGATWKWYKNGCGSGVVVGTGSSLAVLPTATTTYFVRAEGGTCGITSCQSITITVNPAPAQPAFIQGPVSGLCGLQGVSYSTPAVSGATSYVWSVPTGATIVSGQGTNAIVVNYGSSLGINTVCGATSICVRSVNACGSSALRCVNLSLAPATPGAIAGQSIVCRTQSYTYSIAPVAGATSYTWTVPSTWQITSGQGTTSITVVAGTMNGEVRVLANNACGASKIARRSVTTFVCSNPGMTMLDEMPELALWPNPANDLVHLDVDQVIPDKVEIYDMLGKRMYEGAWTNEFDVTLWPSGMYIVRVSLGEEHLIQRLEIAH